MIRFLPFIALPVYAFLQLTGCSSLKTSRFEHSMQMQGSFACGTQVIPGIPESPAEADVARIRCYRDQWELSGPDRTFTRIYYQTRQCEVPLGKIIYQQKGTSTGNCVLIRSNLSWLAEEKGKCRLTQLKQNIPTSPDALNHCGQYVPSFCKTPQPELTFSSTTYLELNASDSKHYQATCRRYQP